MHLNLINTNKESFITYLLFFLFIVYAQVTWNSQLLDIFAVLHSIKKEFQAKTKSDSVRVHRYPKLAENKDVRQRNSNLTALHPDSFLSDRGKKATLKIFD
ncbi:hypothetical protein ES332_A03G162100v1 [Gossypium tomentosum]|uniref:Uncharacterized protein n=1 Tax=Gossypium tomentosum TaxID=34277 RepID=A0A5D2R8U1_GOSTO|nr:hypothetical protein ES332_A03G162100v1 [Gossypium tomentosum]